MFWHLWFSGWVACVDSFILSLKTFDFSIYVNVDSNHVILFDLSLPQHVIATAGDVAVRAYHEALEDGEANPVDEANAMRARIKDKSLALRQKLGKLTVVANLELGDRFLAQVIIIDFICVPI
jgi:hypothetical protein